MDNRTVINIFNLAVGVMSILMLSEYFGIFKASERFHYWLSGCYTGVMTFALILFIVSKVQQRRNISKEFREIL